jgi:hypothetical protein
MLVVVCPSCHHKLRPPAHLAGRRVTCPNCLEAVTVPVPAIPEGVVADLPAAEEPSTTDPPPTPVRLGMAALALGLGSVLVLCLPVIGYLSLALSGVGVLLGLWGWWHALRAGTGTRGGTLVRGSWVRGGFGTRAGDYPLAGIAACLLALTLALLPVLLR